MNTKIEREWADRFRALAAEDEGMRAIPDLGLTAESWLDDETGQRYIYFTVSKAMLGDIYEMSCGIKWADLALDPGEMACRLRVFLKRAQDAIRRAEERGKP